MEAATPLRQPRVTAHGDRVEIDGLLIVDETLARLVVEAGNPDEVVTDAVEIGARVLDREQTAANAEFVRTEFEKVAKTVETEFGDRARVAAEQLGERLDDVFDPQRGQLARALEELFSDGSSKAVQNRTREMVGELLQGSREDLLKLFAAGDGSNPLAALGERTVDEIRAADRRQREGQQLLLGRVHELEKQLQGLRDEKVKLEELARERERGTAKGRTYEESVCDAVDRVAGPQGDLAEAVGDETGAGGRMGDVLVMLDAAAGPARGRIVFEAKDRKLSKPAFLEQLDAARAQRDADYAVLVVPSEEEVPAKLHSLREYYGDKMIAVYDPEDGSTLELEFAYRVARARVAMTNEGGDELDAAALRAGVGRALDAVEGVRKVKSQLTSAEGCIGNAKELLETLAAQVREQLAEIDSLLTPAADSQ
jgi:Uncharacterized protein conserved in bacteria (DUF2130)